MEVCEIADNRSAARTSPRTRQAGLADHPRLSNALQHEPVPLGLRARLPQCWRDDARRHRRNGRWHLAGHLQDDHYCIEAGTISMATSETNVHPQKEREKEAARNARLER